MKFQDKSGHTDVKIPILVTICLPLEKIVPAIGAIIKICDQDMISNAEIAVFDTYETIFTSSGAIS